MRFSVLAIAALFASGSMSQQDCKPGAYYCGWALAGTEDGQLGWADVPDSKYSLWVCDDSGQSASYSTHCKNGCIGDPLNNYSAICAVGTGATSMTSTTCTTRPGEKVKATTPPHIGYMGGF
ncbi:hypothetical protein BJX96DRAFT_170002 [Aspergillus floccosus]